MSSFLDKLRTVRTRLGPLWWHTGLMFGASRMGDLIGICIAMFLVPAWVTEEKLGVVLPITRLAALASMPAAAMSSTAIKYLNRFLLHGEHGKVRSLLRDLALFSFAVSIPPAVAVFFLWPSLRNALRMDDAGLLPLTVLLIVLTCWTPVAFMMAQGLKRFYLLSLSRVMGPVGRLVVILLLLKPLQVTGYMAGQIALVFFSGLVLLHGPLVYVRRHREWASYRSELPDMLRYTIPVATSILLIGVQQAVEPWAVRQLVSDLDSAGYYIAYMFGSIPVWVAPAMLPFLFPVVSERYERGESTRKMHIQTMGLVVSIGLVLVGGLALWGASIFDWWSSWRPYADYAPYAWILALATTVDTALLCHITHESACRRFAYLRYCAPALVAETVLLVVFILNLHPGTTVIGLPALLSIMLVPRAVVLAGMLFELLRWRNCITNRDRKMRGTPFQGRGDGRAAGT